jgi:hypothetical protein
LNPPAAQLWTDLRCQLRRSLEAATTPACFGVIRSCCPSLGRFAAVDDLLRYLADDLGAELDIKTAMYAELVRCAQIGGSACSLAQTVLWLGLWRRSMSREEAALRSTCERGRLCRRGGGERSSELPSNTFQTLPGGRRFDPERGSDVSRAESEHEGLHDRVPFPAEQRERDRRSQDCRSRRWRRV